MTKQRPLDKELTEKEKVIREAYGEHWDEVKDNLMNDGWTIWPKVKVEELKKEFVDTCDVSDGRLSCRPKSLRGIETNNGWFSIKEHGLPKEKGNYDFLIREDYRINPEDFEITKIYVSYSLVLNKNMAWHVYSHWKPITQLKPPLY